MFIKLKSKDVEKIISTFFQYHIIFSKRNEITEIYINATFNKLIIALCKLNIGAFEFEVSIKNTWAFVAFNEPNKLTSVFNSILKSENYKLESKKTKHYKMLLLKSKKDKLLFIKVSSLNFIKWPNFII